MTRLDDRLHESGEDLYRAATTIAHRPIGRPRPIARGLRAVVVTFGLAGLVALPIWLGVFGDSQRGARVGESGEGSTSADPESRELGGAGVPGIIADLHGWVSHEEAIRLTEEVRSWDGVVDATLVTREAAESEMRSMITVITTVSGFTDTDAETSPLNLLSIRIVLADPPRSTPWLAVTDRLSAGGSGLVSHLWEVFPQDES